MSGATSFIMKAREVHGDKYDYSQVVYVNSKTKVQIVCRTHGVFEQMPDKHVNGRCGCPACAGNVRSSVDDFIAKARSVHGDKYDYSQVRYVNSKTKVCIVCPLHGSFLQTPSNHLSGKGCAECADNVAHTVSDFVEAARVVHGDTYDYSHVIYQNERTPVEIVCKMHGVFKQIPYVHLQGCGCPSCGRENQIIHRDEQAILEKSRQTFLAKYGVSNPMYDAGIRQRHLNAVRSDVVNDKRWATKRKNGTQNGSKIELQMYDALCSIFGENDVQINYKSDEYPFRCDFYIVSRRLYIELNAHWSHGGHWYSEADADRVSAWNSGTKFYRNSAHTFCVRDVEKRNFARLNCLNYVVFWKTDLSDFHKWVELGCPDGIDWDREYSWLI